MSEILPLKAKFIVFKSEVIALVLDDDGLWRSADGGIFAYRDSSSSVDQSPVCGVGPATLPRWPFFQQLNEACAVHDYLYESPAYQAFHTRDEADDFLRRLLELKYHNLVGVVFADLARLLGASLWEDERTR